VDTLEADIGAMQMMGEFGKTAFVRCFASVFAIALLGCGENKPTLDDSGDYFVQAQTALDAGDTAKAVELLSLSIESKPYPFAYFQRARIYVDQGKDAEALADSEAGLALDSDNADLKWLRDELKKPKANRFKGKFKNPPQAVK
jgi:hypothetical protein